MGNALCQRNTPDTRRKAGSSGGKVEDKDGDVDVREVENSQDI